MRLRILCRFFNLEWTAAWGKTLLPLHRRLTTLHDQFLATEVEDDDMYIAQHHARGQNSVIQCYSHARYYNTNSSFELAVAVARHQQR